MASTHTSTQTSVRVLLDDDAPESPDTPDASISAAESVTGPESVAPDFQALFDAACVRTSEARAVRDALLETPDEFIRKVSVARAKVLTGILESAGDKILDAAEKGYGSADILTFNGNDFVDDVSLLFLLKGPRPHTPPIPEGTPGPLLPDLRATMAPFEIVHDWDGVTGGNRVVARWNATKPVV